MSGSGITGDGLEELEDMIARYDAAGTAVTRALRAAAPKIQAQCRTGYAENRGPDGVKWKPNKDGTYPSLSRPAALVTFTGEGDSIVGEGEDVLKYHQEGNEKLPRRPVFPEQGTIPASWEPIIEDALRVELGDPK